MKMNLTTIGALCGVVAFAAGGLRMVDRYFAKSAEMSQVVETLDIRSSDADIRYQEQRIERIQMQRRPQPLPADAEDRLREERKKLEQLEKEREQKKEMYRSKK